MLFIGLSPATKKLIGRTLKTLALFYVLLCLLLYFFQEKFIFFPQKLDKNFRFSFSTPFEELTVHTADGCALNGLLFRVPSPKGLIFYLHGNSGALNTWGTTARRYTELGYDVFFFDYRGYGKSEGRISGRQQFLDDAQAAYEAMKERYREDAIVVAGYSLGTGAAANLAAANKPRLLILHAPYYSLADLMTTAYPFVPTFLLKYNFETIEYLKGCKAPVVVFHGDRDEVITHASSVQLKQSFKSGDTLITLTNQGHNGITDNAQYRHAVKAILQ